MLISKSDFQTFRKCPDAFWMMKYAKDQLKEKKLSDFQKQIIEQGHVVESWARKLFPTGVLVQWYNQTAAQQTQQLIRDCQQVIFQATFIADGLLTMCDILEYDNQFGTWNMYEVKGTTSRERPKADHYWDIAFQSEVLRRAGIDVGTLYLVELNKEFTKNGNIDVSDLLKVTDITSEINDIQIDLMSTIDIAKSKLKQKNQPSACDCRYKSRAKQCEAFDFFYPNTPEYSVYDLRGIRTSKKLTTIIDAGILAIEDIPDENSLNTPQSNQVYVHNYDTVICQKKKIKEELSQLEYPIYFLDYETYPSAIPVFDGCRPFQQVPFQFSLHVQESSETELKHYEFLHQQGTNPIPQLSQKLREYIGDTGSVIVWNKSFEAMCNKDMAHQMPELADFLLGINKRFYDLEDPFQKQLYVRKEFRGKTSIKYILPVLAPEFSYKDLNIQDGGSACNAWKKMIFELDDPNEKESIYHDLLAYCYLVTLAMVRILDILKKV